MALYDPTVRACIELRNPGAVIAALKGCPWYEEDADGVPVPLAPEYLDALYCGIARNPTAYVAMAAYTAGVWTLRSHGINVDTESSVRIPVWASALNKALDGLHWAVAAALTGRPAGGIVMPREFFETTSPLAPHGVARALTTGVNVALNGVRFERGPANAKGLMAALRWSPTNHHAWCDTAGARGAPGTAEMLLCVAARLKRPPRRLPALPAELWLLFVEYASVDDMCQID